MNPMDVERTMEFIREQQAQTAVVRARHEAEIARLDLRLRHAIRLAVQEVRSERKRRRELDARFDLRMDRIAAAHLVAEETVARLGERVDKLGWRLDQLGEKIDKLADKLDRFVDASLHPGNGHQG